MNKNEINNDHDIAYYATDSRLAGPSDGNRYRWREMIVYFQKLGRPLTEEEANQFRIQ